MRTTKRLDDDQLSKARLYAARSGKTLTVVIEDALRKSLARTQQAARREPARLTTVAGRGPQANVDLDDSAVLLALMESPDDPA